MTRSEPSASGSGWASGGVGAAAAGGSVGVDVGVAVGVAGGSVGVDVGAAVGAAVGVASESEAGVGVALGVAVGVGAGVGAGVATAAAFTVTMTCLMAAPETPAVVRSRETIATTWSPAFAAAGTVMVTWNVPDRSALTPGPLIVAPSQVMSPRMPAGNCLPSRVNLAPGATVWGLATSVVPSAANTGSRLRSRAGTSTMIGIVEIVSRIRESRVGPWIGRRRLVADPLAPGGDPDISHGALLPRVISGDRRASTTEPWSKRCLDFGGPATWHGTRPVTLRPRLATGVPVRSGTAVDPTSPDRM